MKYTIGYQLPDEYDSTVALCADYRDSISGVYFSWANEKSGRMPICADDAESVAQVESVQLDELKKIRELGIDLALLLNANCYGKEANSSSFAERILKLCRFLKDKADICSVTTTSPFVASTLKKHFGKDLLVTASVNMRIDSVLSMKQLSPFFDSFYIRKEYNRDLAKIAEFKSWCNNNGKKLCILANSGCLAYCGFQTYHDNLVAHHGFLQENGEGFPAPCWKHLHRENREDALAQILSANWIRPEDVKNYAPYFDEMKLATRMHSSPRRVVSAYARGRFPGNIMDLTEPSYSPLFKGCVLDNTLIPANFFEVTSACNKNCDSCSFCKETAKKALRIFD